jgi:DNA polymerase I-like protein with 3'-5' exonuclease and polymerase domains
MPRIDRTFEEERLDAHIVGQVHDSIIGECRPELLARVKEIVVQSMTDWPTGRLRLRVDFDSGPNWAEC